MTEVGSAGFTGGARPDRAGFQAHDLHLAWHGQPPLCQGWRFDLGPGLHHLQGERGKSSLLRLLGGDGQAWQGLNWSGHFQLHGQPWAPALEGDPRVFHFDPRSPVWDGYTPEALELHFSGRHGARFDAVRWQQQLAGFDLLPHRGKRMDMLSTGSRRKLMLAGALASGAELLLLDEPTAGLDRPSLAWLGQALAGVAAAALAGATPVWLLAAPWGLQDELPWASTLDLPTA